MPSNITPPRVPFVDVKTGLISKEWYRFLLTLFTLTGAGQNTASITDLQVGPPSLDVGEVQAILGQMNVAPSDGFLRSQVAELIKKVRGLEEGPPDSGAISQVAALFKQIQGLQVAPPPFELGGVLKGIQGLQVGDPTPAVRAQQEEMLKALQGIQVGPPVIPSTAPLTMTNTAPLDFPSTAAQTSSDLTVTVPGAVDGDVVTLAVPNACVLANSCYTGWVSAANTVTVRFNNYSSGALDPASGTFRVVVTRF